jgi:hypothetical protein
MNTTGPAWDEWKKALVTLPDSAFFALVRHYLGPIQTPFNKQILVGDLVDRLSSGESAANRRLLLTEAEADVLAALLYLGPSAPEELAEFLGEPLTTLALRLVNLEERLWTFRRTETGRVVYVASPLTNDEVVSVRLAPGRFFSGYPHSVEDGPPLFDEALFLALYAALADSPLEKNQNGEWKKRPRRDFVDRFKDLPGGEEALDFVLSAAEKLGLVVWENQHTRLAESYWEDLGSLTEDDRRALLACSFGPWKLGQLNAAAKGFWEFCGLVQPNTAYSWTVLRRLASRVPVWKSPNDRETLLKAWVRTGYLVPGTVPETWAFRARAPERSGAIILEANFEWRLSKGGSWSQTLAAVRASRLLRWDRHPHFELTKAAFSRGVLLGLSASILGQILSELTLRNLPQNVKVSFSEWEREARSVRLWRGLVLQVDPAKVPLLEHAPAFQAAVLETLAPGIYLLDPEAVEDVARDLSKLGFPSFPAVQEAQKSDVDGHPWSFAHWTAGPPPVVAPTEFATFSPALPNAEGEKLLETWQKKIETSARKEEEKEELLGRLRRRLFVEEAQLDFPVTRGERLEAKGLDYIGKLRLIEQALASAYDTLEIVARDSEGQPVSITVRPIKLEKQGTEMSLRAENIQNGTPFQGLVSRMALVRRIRGSLFW